MFQPTNWEKDVSTHRRIGLLWSLQSDTKPMWWHTGGFISSSSAEFPLNSISLVVGHRSEGIVTATKEEDK